MKKILFILMAIYFGMTACVKNSCDPPMDTDQTVLFYLPWSVNLTSYFVKNIEDLEQTISNNILKNERVFVFFASSASSAVLFELKYQKEGISIRDTINQYLSPAFIEPEWITSLLYEVKEKAPANRYAMVVGGHGMGWLPVGSGSRSGRISKEKEYWEYEGVPKTRWFGGTDAQYQMEITTLAQGIRGAGITMEYIMFDDCYMSSIEVAYDLKSVTNHLIACPTEIMVYGFPYHIIGEHLIGDVDYHGVCQGFYDFYSAYTYPYGTVGVIDCTELDNLAAIMLQINRAFTFDKSLRSNIQRMDGYSPTRFFDLGDYVDKLCSDSELLNRFNAQLERTVIEKRHTERFYSAVGGTIPITAYSGVTTSDPSVSQETAAKGETSWYKATH